MMAEPLKLQDLALKNVSSMLVKALVNLPEAASTQRVRDYFEGNLPGVVIRSIR